MLHLLTKKEKGLKASSRVFIAMWNVSSIILHLPPVSGQEGSVAHQKKNPGVELDRLVHDVALPLRSWVTLVCVTSPLRITDSFTL